MYPQRLMDEIVSVQNRVKNLLILPMLTQSYPDLVVSVKGPFFFLGTTVFKTFTVFLRCLGKTWRVSFSYRKKKYQ